MPSVLPDICNNRTMTGARGNPDGTVTVGLTAEQIEAQTQSGTEAAPNGK